MGIRLLYSTLETAAEPSLPTGAAPDGRAVGAASASRCRSIHLEGPSVLGLVPMVLVRLAIGMNATTPDAPLQPRRRLRHPGAHVTAKDRSEFRRTNDETTTIRGALPPTNPVAPRSRLAPTSSHERAATAPRLRHRRSGFQQAFTAHPWVARPHAASVIHRTAFGHLLLVGFCNVMSPGHANDSFELRLLCSEPRQVPDGHCHE